MAEAAKAALEVETLTVIADTGYSNGQQGQACQDAGITAAVPRQKTTNPKDTALFSRDAFTYDATATVGPVQPDSLTGRRCPKGG